MPRFNNINGERIQFTQAEETARDLEEAQYAVEQIELAKTQYQRDRASEYPPVTDYLDGIVKGDTAQVDKYISDCQAVKLKYPKEAN
jgi:hypothetical protein